MAAGEGKGSNNRRRSKATEGVTVDPRKKKEIINGVVQVGEVGNKQYPQGCCRLLHTECWLHDNSSEEAGQETRRVFDHH